MATLFYISAVIAILATLMVAVRANIVHALLYMLVSLLAVAMVLYTLGAAYAAVMEIIVYAGAILILFVFVIMMVNISAESVRQERSWLGLGVWLGPVFLGLVLLGELLYVLLAGPGAPMTIQAIGAREVGASMFGAYMIGVELMSMLLLAGLVGAYHLARSLGGPAGPSQQEDQR
jgi:NADH-quinone oxidoreductase subunit J